jgi:hypothetical protein
MGPELGVRTNDGTVVVTTKVALARSPLVPFTVTIYGPGVAGVGGPVTMKLLADNWPVEVIVQAGDANKVGVVGDCISGRHEPASKVLKPLPVIVTLVETGPEIGVTVICGPVTTKSADAISPVLPFTETVYVPGVTGVASPATVKLVADN